MCCNGNQPCSTVYSKLDGVKTLKDLSEIQLTFDEWHSINRLADFIAFLKNSHAESPKPVAQDGVKHAKLKRDFDELRAAMEEKDQVLTAIQTRIDEMTQEVLKLQQERDKAVQSIQLVEKERKDAVESLETLVLTVNHLKQERDNAVSAAKDQVKIANDAKKELASLREMMDQEELTAVPEVKAPVKAVSREEQVDKASELRYKRDAMEAYKRNKAEMEAKARMEAATFNVKEFPPKPDKKEKPVKAAPDKVYQRDVKKHEDAIHPSKESVPVKPDISPKPAREMHPDIAALTDAERADLENYAPVDAAEDVWMRDMGWGAQVDMFYKLHPEEYERIHVEKRPQFTEEELAAEETEFEGKYKAKPASVKPTEKEIAKSFENWDSDDTEEKKSDWEDIDFSGGDLDDLPEDD